jgi:hypothetical protein
VTPNKPSTRETLAFFPIIITEFRVHHHARQQQRRGESNRGGRIGRFIDPNPVSEEEEHLVPISAPARTFQRQRPNQDFFGSHGASAHHSLRGGPPQTGTVLRHCTHSQQTNSVPVQQIIKSRRHTAHRCCSCRLAISWVLAGGGMHACIIRAMRTGVAVASACTGRLR